MSQQIDQVKMPDDETRDEIEEIVNDEPVQEAAQEEEIKPVKAKPKANAKAKPKIKKKLNNQ